MLNAMSIAVNSPSLVHSWKEANHRTPWHKSPTLLVLIHTVLLADVFSYVYVLLSLLSLYQNATRSMCSYGELREALLYITDIGAQRLATKD